MNLSRLRRVSCAAALLLAAGGASPAPPPSPKWAHVDYGSLVDGRKLTHSGEPVGVVLARLGGRPMPAAGERREDALAYRLLDPILEPYAFVLADALDTLAPRPGSPMVEVGSLWDTGDAQPAWVELARARRLFLESDGQGHLRAYLPAASLEGSTDPIDETADPVAADKEAWAQAWPVLRHALAGERRRLARGHEGVLPPLDVEVHAYRHQEARGVFDLAVTPWRVSVADTLPAAGAAPLDLAGLASIFERGLTLEGARLEPSGRVRWFASEPERRQTILGRPPTLADAAVAYRAVAAGGIGEPYMSLDRAAAPQIAIVNYGGRLRDTALGLVSLLSDVRFKTFSVGVDILGPGDVRDAVRRTLPEFRTHLERFASDPSAGAVLNQQTRFWFYPDDVDLTLSQEGDVLAFRKVRMSAASERVRDAGSEASDPPWTKDTVAYLNAHYDALAAQFPEMADLDESVRLLALFTWLTEARARGLAVPDLDVLMAQVLPPLPTPRRFPQLLSHDVLPPPGANGIVDVLDRTSLGEALDRLEPRGTQPLPAGRRFARDQAMLNPQIPDQAALANEMGALPPTADTSELDRCSYRAERLLMHARVLATVPAERAASIDARRKKEPATRVFSVGIGGVDLGMSAVLARAQRRGGRLGLGNADRAARPVEEKGRPTTAVVAAQAAADPPGLPESEWPDHGLGAEGDRQTTKLPEGRGTIVQRRLPGELARQGTFNKDGAAVATWDEVVLASEGPEARARRRSVDTKTGTVTFSRLEDGRFLTYRFDRAEGTLRAVAAASPIPVEAYGEALPAADAPLAVPPALAVMDLATGSEAGAMGERSERPTITVRLRSAGGGSRAATIPRAVLQRLLRGRAIDMSPDRPLPAFTPAAGVLGSARTLMILANADETRAPWTGSIAPRPGEEDAARLAAALARWWSPEPAAGAVVVGVDPQASLARWARAPVSDGSIAVIAAADAFPQPAAGLRAAFDGLPADPAPAKLVVVVSAESPGVLGRRLRAMAADPAMDGKVLAAVSMGGALRGDLPASLLAEGHLAAFGICDAGPLGLSAAAAEGAAWARRASGEPGKGRRPEDLPGPFTWFY